MELFDTHAHYNDEKFEKDRESIIKNTYEAGITKFICAGYNLKSSQRAIDIANKYEYIYATCGISPNDLEDYKDENLEVIKILGENYKCVAIGEIGLDYFWGKENKDIQKEVFIKQIEIANELDLPIVIHSRDAAKDTIEILKKYKVKRNGVFHCCQQNEFLIEEALKLGFYISFAGPITFKNSKNADKIVKMVPINKILIETDSPYLAPEPVRGTRNDCRNVKYIAKKISEVKQMELEEFAQISYNNAMQVFEINK